MLIYSLVSFMFKSEYKKEIVDVIKDIVFLNSYNENLVGICLYGYYDTENDLELICFYKGLDKNNHNTFATSYVIGDTYIRTINLDFNRYRAFKPEITNGVIIYDPNSELSNVLNSAITNGKKYTSASNEISFDGKFTKELIDSIILNKAKNKDDIEKYNSILEIYSNMISCKTDFDYDESDLFIDSFTSYIKLYMDDNELNIHTNALKEAVNNCFENKNSLVKKNRK